MARLKSLDISVALMPLISGNVQVTKVTLVDPEVELERLADGIDQLHPARENLRAYATALRTGGHFEWYALNRALVLRARTRRY
jgi:hypothetical protein